MSWPYLWNSETRVKIIKNEVGCRDDTVPITVGTRRIEITQQSSATPVPTSCFWGVAEARLVHALNPPRIFDLLVLIQV